MGALRPLYECVEKCELGAYLHKFKVSVHVYTGVLAHLYTFKCVLSECVGCAFQC